MGNTNYSAYKAKKSLADRYGLEHNDVRCYHCKHWGYNNGEGMDDYGWSECPKMKFESRSSQWCESFEYVGNNA